MAVTGFWAMEMMISFDVAGLLTTQVSLEANIQVMVSSASGMYLNVDELDPVSIPLIHHWKTGIDPPFTGVAINVVESPAQTVSFEVEIIMLTVSIDEQMSLIQRIPYPYVI